MDRTFVNPFTGQVQDKFAAQLQAQGINPLTGREYGFNVKSGLTAAQQLQQQQFNAANLIDPQTGLQYGFDTGTGLTAAQELAQKNIIDSLMAQGVDVGGTGRLIGFDEETGLSAAEQLAQKNVLANLVAQGIDVDGTGMAYGFDTETGLTAGQQLDQENFLTNLTAQGIDMNPTIQQQDPLTGYMQTVPNPNYGLDYSFDTEAGLSFDEKIAQGTLDLAIKQMEADEQADLLKALGGSEGSPSDNIMANLMSVASNPIIEAEFEAVSGKSMDDIIKDVRDRLGVLGATKYTNENVAFALIEKGYGSLVDKLLNMSPMATLGTDQIELMGGQIPVDSSVPVNTTSPANNYGKGLDNYSESEMLELGTTPPLTQGELSLDKATATLETIDPVTKRKYKDIEITPILESRINEYTRLGDGLRPDILAMRNSGPFVNMTEQQIRDEAALYTEEWMTRVNTIKRKVENAERYLTEGYIYTGQ